MSACTYSFNNVRRKLEPLAVIKIEVSSSLRNRHYVLYEGIFRTNQKKEIAFSACIKFDAQSKTNKIIRANLESNLKVAKTGFSTLRQQIIKTEFSST